MDSHVISRRSPSRSLEKQPLLDSTDVLVDLPETSRLKTRNKVFYGIGGMPYPMTSNIIAFYISLFLLEVARIRPAYASAIVFSGRAWDAITDPTVGVLVQKTETRFGKMKPWIVLSTPFAVASYFLLWIVPDITTTSKLAYYLVIYCCFQSFLTCYHLPYAAMTMYLSDQQADRDSATAFRMTCEVLGFVVGVAIQAAFLTIGSYTGEDLDPCADGNSTDIPTLAPGERHPMEMAFILAAATIGGLFIVCSMFVALGTSETTDDAIDNAQETQNFFKSLKEVFTHGPYIKLLLCFLCVSLSLQIVQGNLALYFLLALEYDNFQLAIMVLLLTTFVCLPLWQMAIKKVGKKLTLGVGMIIEIPILGSLFFIPGNVIVIYAISVLSGAVLGVAYLCPWSMIPDVIDDFTVKTGTRKEALFYSFYVFFTKFAVGVALGISTLVLEFAGYQSGACQQPESVELALRVLVSFAPVCLLLLGLLFLWFYPITEMRRSETRAKLAEIRERRRSSVAAGVLYSADKTHVSSGSLESESDERANGIPKSSSNVKFVFGDVAEEDEEEEINTKQ
ncbi:sodium-dependent lysophosphatidylcholine symporter 1-like [Ptychodera flava]|uniref:sodium-dependent lysophosphatidylcholine symporter 1-like n=1 Tax=Ptychodera flava TaxID=63121 RepID=UPI003969CC13